MLTWFIRCVGDIYTARSDAFIALPMRARPYVHKTKCVSTYRRHRRVRHQDAVLKKCSYYSVIFLSIEQNYPCRLSGALALRYQASGCIRVKFHADLEYRVENEHKLLGGSPLLIGGSLVSVVAVSPLRRTAATLQWPKVTLAYLGGHWRSHSLR